MEEAWFEIVIARSSTVNTIQAGVSAMLAEVLHLFFGSDGHDVSTAGISVQHPDDTRRTTLSPPEAPPRSKGTSPGEYSTYSGLPDKRGVGRA